MDYRNDVDEVNKFTFEADFVTERFWKQQEKFFHILLNNTK